MTLDLPAVDARLLSAEAQLADSKIAVRLAGTADVEARPQLEAFIKQLHVEAVRHVVAAVEIDLRALGFMNSSSFKIFVTWLAQVRDLPPPSQYRITIRSNPNLLWQRRSLAALSCFAIDVVTIET